MVESFASGITNGGFSDGDCEEDYVELLLDYQLGPGRIRALAYCDDLEVLNLAMSDGSLISFQLEIKLEKDEDEDDDDYGDETLHKTVILKRTYEQIEGAVQSGSETEEQIKLMKARES
jgi:hypothetical protein